MKAASYERLGISVPRIVTAAASASLAAVVGAGVALGGVMGEGTSPTLLVLGALVFYIVMSAPRRIVDGRRLAQSREAVILSAASLACLNVTKSRARTVLMITR